MNFSKPTREQVVHGLDRVLLTFVTASAIVLGATKDPFSKATWVAAGAAGAVAVWQLVISTLTNR
jgi:predicted transcriptional regulator